MKRGRSGERHMPEQGCENPATIALSFGGHDNRICSMCEQELQPELAATAAVARDVVNQVSGYLSAFFGIGIGQAAPGTPSRFPGPGRPPWRIIPLLPRCCRTFRARTQARTAAPGQVPGPPSAHLAQQLELSGARMLPSLARAPPSGEASSHWLVVFGQLVSAPGLAV